MTRHTVLITGMSGLIGAAIRRRLEGRFDLRALNRSPVEGVSWHRADIHFSVWCSRRDVAQMVERCIAAPESLRFDVFFVVSDNRWGYRPVEHARPVLGYVPEDQAEDRRAPGERPGG
jgi:hypothetical protein